MTYKLNPGIRKMKKYCLNHTQELREHTEKDPFSRWDNFEGVVYPGTLMIKINRNSSLEFLISG